MIVFVLMNHNKLTFNFAYLAIFNIYAILTTFMAAYYKSYVMNKLNPESTIIYFASSILVPFILKTIGFFIPKALIPLINPNAITSALNINQAYLAIPAKMLTNIL
jgi:hypothetical protein